MKQVLSQKAIDSPPLGALTASYLCLINVFSHFGFLHSCAGCMQGEARRGTSIHSEECTPSDDLFPSGGQQGSAFRRALLWNFISRFVCLLIFIGSLDENQSRCCQKAKSALYSLPWKGQSKPVCESVRMSWVLSVAMSVSVFSVYLYS